MNNSLLFTENFARDLVTVRYFYFEKFRIVCDKTKFTVLFNFTEL